MTRHDIDVATLRQALDGMWSPIELVEETGSTNADLVRRATDDDCAGAVLLTNVQRMGRGRHGRAWSTPAGAQLAMSVVVDADMSAASAMGWLPLLTGVAVCVAITETFSIEASMKWPNDVLVMTEDGDGVVGKVAGILAELTPRGQAVIGMGINTGFAADELPVPTAASLNLVTGTDIDRTAFATAVLTRLHRQLQFWPNDIEALATGYREVSATIGTDVRVELPGGEILTGTATDVDELGRIMIDTGGAEPVSVAAGDVTHLRPA